MPCLRGLSVSYRPGLGYGHGGRFREGRQLPARYEEPYGDEACCPIRGRSDEEAHSVSGRHSSSGSLTFRSAAACRLGRNA